MECSAMIELLFALFFRTECYEPRIAVAASYSLRSPAEETLDECCGQCAGGKIIHGDGHITDCPCPETCECKTTGAAVVQPEMVITDVVTEDDCPDGTCRLPPKKSTRVR